MIRVKADRIRAYAEREGLMQYELAQKMGVSPAYVSRVLRGYRTTASERFIVGLIKLSGYPFEHFFEIDMSKEEKRRKDNEIKAKQQASSSSRG